MFTKNTIPTYQMLTQILDQETVPVTAAEMHGLISGFLCGGNHDASWQKLLLDLTNEGKAFSPQLNQILHQLYDTTQITLEDDAFMFQLMIPDDVEVFERADALAGWVNHFLLGLGMMQPKLDQSKNDDVGEAINDLHNIAKLGYDENEDQEELERSLEVIVEYVRVAAILCYTEFTQLHLSELKESKPTLH